MSNSKFTISMSFVWVEWDYRVILQKDSEMTIERVLFVLWKVVNVIIQENRINREGFFTLHCPSVHRNLWWDMWCSCGSRKSLC